MRAKATTPESYALFFLKEKRKRCYLNYFHGLINDNDDDDDDDTIKNK